MSSIVKDNNAVVSHEVQIYYGLRRWIRNSSTKKKFTNIPPYGSAGLQDVEKAQMCGWLKDKYGLSWQVIPTVLVQMLQDKDKKKSEKVMGAMLQMKKIDIKTLKQAYEQG